MSKVAPGDGGAATVERGGPEASGSKCSGSERPQRWRRRPGLGLGPGRARGGLAILAVLAVVSVVGACLLAATVVDDQRTDLAAAEGRRAATDLTPALLSYGWRTIDVDAARIDAAGTGPFAEQNRAVMSGLVKPAATANQADSSARVSSASVISAAPGQAVILVLFTQTTTMPSLPGPRIDNRSARVTVVQGPDDRWLVSAFDAV